MLDWSFSPAQYWSSETGDTLLGIGVLAGAEAHVVRWTAARGRVNLGLLPEGAAAPAMLAMTASEAGDVIVGTLGNPAEGGRRVFRWTESSGSTQLGALAGLPADASYMMTHLSADGSVVVGSVQIPGQPASLSLPPRVTSMHARASGGYPGAGASLRARAHAER